MFFNYYYVRMWFSAALYHPVQMMTVRKKDGDEWMKNDTESSSSSSRRIVSTSLPYINGITIEET